MMIEALVSMSRYLSARQDDDFIDRINYLYTPNILLALSVLISFKQFGGRPLECMFPNKFPGSWEQYAENFCWSEDTYYLPLDVHVATIPEQERSKGDRKLSYYQWVPFFLLFQAICFRLPSFFWSGFNLNSGIRVHDIITEALQPNNLDDEVRKSTLHKLSLHITRAINFQHRLVYGHIFVHKITKFFNMAYSTSFIGLAYLFVKLLYLTNVLIQLFLMNKFLETDKYHWYGIGIIEDLIRGVPWTSSGYFPRVSLCDFTVRQVANIQRYTVQCVLLINIFNEKIFILLWILYTFLAIATSISILFWLVILIIPSFSQNFINHLLELNEEFDKYKNTKHVNKFVNNYLKQSGVFLFRMVVIHAGIIFASELAIKVYHNYCEHKTLIVENGKKYSEIELNTNSFINDCLLEKVQEKNSNDIGNTLDN